MDVAYIIRNSCNFQDIGTFMVLYNTFKRSVLKHNLNVWSQLHFNSKVDSLRNNLYFMHIFLCSRSVIVDTLRNVKQQVKVWFRIITDENVKQVRICAQCKEFDTSKQW